MVHIHPNLFEMVFAALTVDLVAVNVEFLANKLVRGAHIGRAGVKLHVWVVEKPQISRNAGAAAPVLNAQFQKDTAVDCQVRLLAGRSAAA